MDWDDAKYFLAIAREGQMLGAARRMNVSQARLSRRLSSLEQAAGVRLFDRSTRGCELTDDGKAFLPIAERVEAAFEGGMVDFRNRASCISGTIRIGAPDGLGSAYLAPRLYEIVADYPDLQVQLVPLPRNFSLSEREADIAIMIGHPAKGRLIAKKLSDYSLSLYAAQAYLARHGVPATVEELGDHKLVGYVEDLIYTPELNYAREFSRDWHSAIEISTAIGQHVAVRSGAGIGILHDFMVQEHDDLVRVLPAAQSKRTYWAVWHENLRGSARVKAVVNLMEGWMKRDHAILLPKST